jgi:hypothetical protein
LILHYIDINLKTCQWEDIRLTINKIKQFEDITFFFALRHTAYATAKNIMGCDLRQTYFFLLYCYLSGKSPKILIDCVK